MENEIWKDVKGYEGYYQVSNMGRVKSMRVLKTPKNGVKCRKNAFLSTKTTHDKQYVLVALCRNGEKKHIQVHRLVAEAFIPNPKNLPCVNHKDEDKTNNCVENLEWCSYQYNNTYGTMAYRSINHPSTSKCVRQLSKTGEPIATYPSIKEASRKTGISYQVLISYLHGRYHTGGGYDWKLITQE